MTIKSKTLQPIVKLNMRYFVGTAVQYNNPATGLFALEEWCILPHARFVKF